MWLPCECSSCLSDGGETLAVVTSLKLLEKARGARAVGGGGAFVFVECESYSEVVLILLRGSQRSAWCVVFGWQDHRQKFADTADVAALLVVCFRNTLMLQLFVVCCRV